MIFYDKKKNNAGFTTVEIAIVLLISGFLMSMYLTLYDSFDNRREYDRTIEHIEILDAVLTEFLGEFGGYPCPADPTLPPNHVDYGIATVCGPRLAAAFPAFPDCTTQRPTLRNTGTESNVQCMNVGSRDVDGDGNNEFVLIGMFPFRTIQLLADDPVVTAETYIGYREYASFDGYDMRYSYAVTEIMADEALSLNNPTNPNFGAISIVDENNLEITNPNPTGPGLAHYVLISHGKDKKGAYSEWGVRSDNCFVSTVPPPLPALPPPPGLPAAGVDDVNDPVFGGALDLQNENCDNNDGVFRKAIRSDRAGNLNYFDDIVFFKSEYETSLWKTANNSPVGERYLYNSNTGNVGVGDGFETPTSKLHVEGDLFVANEIQSEEGFCDGLLEDRNPANDTIAPLGALSDWSECMQVDFFVGTGSDCPAGEVAVGVDRNELICEPLLNSLLPLTINVNCPLPGEAVVGVQYNRSTNTFTGICG